MRKSLRIGYVPLTDAALLHIAKGQGFAAARGLDLELVPEPSWANIRDKLAAGYFDAAHMLAPAAIAVSLGLAQVKAELVAPVALGLNGNAITVSKALYEAIAQQTGEVPAGPQATSQALKRIAAKRRGAGEPPLTFGHVFPFSTHHYQLRLWLRSGQIDIGEDVRLVVVPPPYMVDTLRKGSLDGFCVGAPWNSLAASAGAGVILHQGLEIVRDCPEKVLAFRAGWAHAHAEEVHAIGDAIGEAARWAGERANRGSVAALLSEAAGPGVTPATIEPVLAGGRGAGAGLRLDEAAIKADPAHALWLYAQMAAAGQCVFSETLAQAAAAVYAPGLGPQITAPSAIPIAFEPPQFSPSDVHGYFAALRSK
jgi:NitT/TauT family transport system ATP-binding protein